MPLTVPKRPVSAEAALYVVGDPISHSLSPAIHKAAYQTLGLNWAYTAARVPSGGLRRFIETSSRGYDGKPPILGMSVTMPLKREAFELADEPSGLAAAMGIANTLVWQSTGQGPVRAENTDVYGIVRAVAGFPVPNSIAIFGSGATALSAVFAAEQLHCSEVIICARNEEAATGLAARARSIGLDASVKPLDAAVTADAVVHTLPGAAANLGLAHPRMTGGWMLAVAYAGSGTSLASEVWTAGGGVVVHGSEMLLHQALAQVRLFVLGSTRQKLPDEESVFSAMRRAAGVELV